MSHTSVPLANTILVKQFFHAASPLCSTYVSGDQARRGFGSARVIASLTNERGGAGCHKECRFSVWSRLERCQASRGEVMEKGASQACNRSLI